MGQIKQARSALLRRLLHDKTANTLAIAAAAMLPLIALVGSGIDASRYFMAAARLQSACDAGALAARQAMLDHNFTAAHRQTGLNFFDQNFQDGLFGSSNGTRNYTSTDAGEVTGTASIRLPTSIMNIFGFTNFDINVSCTADINISNTDIMFVLDVTGSMNCSQSSPGCGNNGNVEASDALIRGLRTAVMSFYDTVQASTSPAAQVRYGVVPYAANVNVGFSLPRQFMANTHTYQSRVPRFQNVLEWQTVSDQTDWMPRVTSNFGSSNTDLYRFNNRSNDPTRADSTDQSRCTSMNGQTYTIGTDRWIVRSSPEYVLNVWPGGSASARAGCRARVERQQQVTVNQFRDYVYCRVTPGVTGNCGVNNPSGSPAGWETVDLSTLYNNNTIQMPTGTNGAFQTLTWNGCIEEAATVNSATWDPVPANAFDLDINLVPSTEAQRWKPMLSGAVWRRLSGSTRTTGNVTTTADNMARPAHDCPARARRLAQITRTDMQTYVNSLQARGSTYHDIGMIWGGRFVSPRGIFQADNENAPNGSAISRHIVFMTDGLLEPNGDQYGTYGIEWWDRRVTTDGTTGLAARHRARFLAACRAARRENITVWTVSFGLPLSQDLIDCASPGRAYQANNNAALTAAFQEIAQKIAALRLTS